MLVMIACGFLIIALLLAWACIAVLHRL